MSIQMSQDVIEAINGELKYQFAPGSLGEVDAWDHGVAGQLVILDVYVQEAKVAWVKNQGDQSALDSLRKVAAIAIRAIWMSSKMKCYYAHPVDTYGSSQEAEDIAFLKSLGLIVVNPAKLSKFIESMDSNSWMNYFHCLVRKCDCLAFRSFPGGKIGAGVQFEIGLMNGFVFELGPRTTGRVLTICRLEGKP